MKPTPRDVRWLVDQLDDQKRRLQNLENRKPGLAYSSIEDGAIREYDKDGALGSQTGKQSDGTHGNVVLNGPKPPRPTDADVTAVPGMLEMRWSGKFADGVVSPLDLKHVAGYVVPVGSVLDLSKQSGVMTGELGDNVQVQVDPGVYNVYLVSWSKAGRFSDAAGPAPVLVPVAADADAIQAALDDLDERYDGVITESGNLGTRLDAAETDITAAEGRLDTAGTRLDDAFGQIGVVDGKATAASSAASTAQQAAGTAQQAADSALTMAGTKARVYYSTSTPSGTASTNDIWRQIDATKNVIGEWYWASGWVKTLISSQSISNLDVGKLTVGTGIISDLVAEHIAGRSARFIQLDVSQLVAVTGTMSEAVITKLFTDVVMSRKITAQMLAVGSFDNIIAEPDFSNGGASWFSISTWSIDPTGSEGGGPAGKLALSAGNQDFFNLPLGRRIDGGSRYLVKLRVRSTVPIPKDGLWLIMRNFNAAGVNTWVNTFSGDARAANVWHTIAMEIQVRDDAVKIDIGFSARTPFTGGDLYVSTVSATRMSDGELVVDGSLKAKHADLEDFAANTGFVADLTARIVKSDMFVGKEFVGGIFTGATFQTSILPDQGMKLDNAGLRAYGPDGGEPVAEIRPDGGTVYQVSNPATGEVLGGIDNEGGVSGTSLTIENETRLDGPVVMGGDPIASNHGSGESGPVVNGRDLLGSTFMNYVEEHPDVSDGNAWLTAVPHGVVGNAWNNSTEGLSAEGEWHWSGTNNSDHSRMMLVDTIEFIAGRMYSLSYRTPAVRDRDGGSGTLGAAIVRRSAPGGTVTAGGGTVIPGTRVYVPAGGVTFTPTATTYMRCPEDIPAGRITLGVELYVYGGRRAATNSTIDARRWELTVADMGMRRIANTGQMVNLIMQDQSTPAPPPPTPAPAPKPPAPKQYTDTVSATWWQAYKGDGTQIDVNPYRNNFVQGRTPYATQNGVMRGLAGIPSQASRLSGATVKKIEVYVYAQSWHASAGGTAVIGVHGNASKPGTWSRTTDDVKRQKMKRPEGRWITLPSSVHAGFKSGSLRGISMYPPSASTSTEYYGIFTGNKTKFRFTYTK